MLRPIAPAGDDTPTAEDFATATCSECGWTCAVHPSGKCAVCNAGAEC
jgi:hypothetical protein